jgi:protein-L-isoaspartate(D-aspartate) O-methyltransferase
VAVNSESPDPFEFKRRQMVERQLRARNIQDERVLDAMMRVPRHEFVSERERGEAYEDHPIGIGESQTISQPYMVAVTLDALQMKPTDKVLEIGTGSGYQTAILAQLAAEVYSVERHPVLAQRAEEVLSRLGYGNAQVFVRDGSLGLPEYAPYDAVAVSAAAPRVPAPLFMQLREGGRMVIPVGAPDVQQLLLVEKVEGRAVTSVIEGCRFVPLVGREGFQGDL